MSFTARVLSFWQINTHVGPSPEDLSFLTEAGIDPLAFLKKLKSIGLVDNPKGIFYKSTDLTYDFMITVAGKKFRNILLKIEKFDSSMNNSA